jgi:hypothetical protein
MDSRVAHVGAQTVALGDEEGHVEHNGQPVMAMAMAMVQVSRCNGAQSILIRVNGYGNKLGMR